jgi:hypothetical protein
MNCIKLFMAAGLLTTTASVFAQELPVSQSSLPAVSWGQMPILPKKIILGQKYTFTYNVQNNSGAYIMHAVPSVSQPRGGISTITTAHNVNTCLRGIQPKQTCEFAVTIFPKKQDQPMFNALLNVTFPGSSYPALSTLAINIPVAQ